MVGGIIQHDMARGAASFTGGSEGTTDVYTQAGAH